MRTVTVKSKASPLTRARARAYLAYQLTEASSIIASLGTVTADMPTSEKAAAKDGLLKIKKSLEAFGNSYANALHYFLAEGDLGLMKTAYDNIQAVLLKLR